MLELPGIMRTGDAEQDVDKILRYLARLVPQLEMELTSAGQDGYGSAMSALSQGLAADTQTTAGALAAHELRRDNPHKVTAAQLGLTLDRLVSVHFAGGGLVVLIGDKRGLQVNVQEITVTVTEWTQHGGIAYADVALGDWDAVIPVPYAVIPIARGGATADCWAGPLTPAAGRESIGTLRIYHECSISVAENAQNDGVFEEERVIPLTIIGLGVFGYGD